MALNWACIQTTFHALSVVGVGTPLPPGRSRATFVTLL